jgi:hypothetical protein
MKNNKNKNTKKIVPVIVIVDELPPIPRVPFNPSHQVVELAKPVIKPEPMQWKHYD